LLQLDTPGNFCHIPAIQSAFELAFRSYFKKRILVQYRGGREVQTDGVAVTATAGILQYFEDLNRAPNAEIEPKDFFELASYERERLTGGQKNIRISGDDFIAFIPADPGAAYIRQL
jgi:hypothetical protein